MIHSTVVKAKDFGNTMATKNQIAQTTWVMKTIQILWAKSHKQIRLEYV